MKACTGYDGVLLHNSNFQHSCLWEWTFGKYTRPGYQERDISVYFIYCSVRMNLRAKPMDLEFSALAWHWIN